MCELVHDKYDRNEGVSLSFFMSRSHPLLIFSFKSILREILPAQKKTVAFFPLNNRKTNKVIVISIKIFAKYKEKNYK